ncbi:hypothetical protein EV681_0817 [Advenella incenata]|uniref:Uncharacterized protein n=1 Tax=Advenella incenata TaxID=267800 RepID=A0A4Q7VRB3_9BURK|nr:hypothetical protein [Advenella incenata]RZT99036.1 hypothetical protein EV681_0817 [Advenella incenata]
MDKYEFRRLQLQRLVDKYGEGFKSKFAKRVQMHPASISHMLYKLGIPGKRLITERTIEQIEKKLSLPTGWFDKPLKHEDGPWPFQLITYQQFLMLDERDHREIEWILKMKFEKNVNNDL